MLLTIRINLLEDGSKKWEIAGCLPYDDECNAAQSRSSSPANGQRIEGIGHCCMLYVQQVSGSHATPSRITHCLFYSGRFHLHTHKNVVIRNKDENLWLPIFTRCDRFLLFFINSTIWPGSGRAGRTTGMSPVCVSSVLQTPYALQLK